MAIWRIRTAFFCHKIGFLSFFLIHFGYELLCFLHWIQVRFDGFYAISKRIKIIIDQKLAHKGLCLFRGRSLFPTQNFGLWCILSKDEHFSFGFRVDDHLLFLTLLLLLLMQTDFVQINGKCAFHATILTQQFAIHMGLRGINVIFLQIRLYFDALSELLYIDREQLNDHDKMLGNGMLLEAVIFHDFDRIYMFFFFLLEMQLAHQRGRTVVDIVF